MAFICLEDKGKSKITSPLIFSSSHQFPSHEGFGFFNYSEELMKLSLLVYHCVLIICKYVMLCVCFFFPFVLDCLGVYLLVLYMT